MKPEPKCICRLLMNTKGNEKKKRCMLLFPLVSIPGRQVVMQHFCEWNEPIYVTLKMLRNPIHSSCTRETSDNRETACQENKNLSLFRSINATGTYSTTALTARVDRANHYLVSTPQKEIIELRRTGHYFCNYTPKGR